MNANTTTPYTEGDEFTTYTPTEDDYRDLAAHYAAMDADNDEPSGCRHESVLTANGWGAYCIYCGETTE